MNAAAVPADGVLAIVGPTASGKSGVAMRVARMLPCEIVSADSRQAFRGMRIGTAQPDPADLREVPHHFVADRPPGAPFDAGAFGTAGRKTILEILGRGRVPLVVGGSGLYVRSLLRGFFEGPGAKRELREELEARFASSGGEALLAELAALDPEAASRLRPSDRRRIVRALEVCLLSGSTITALRRTGVPIPFRPLQVGLRWPRRGLYERIDARVIGMVNEGLVEETRALLDGGHGPALEALGTVGYREAVDHLAGRIDRREMIALIQRNSRRFAKRQLTWFRADPSIRWLDVSSPDDLARAAGEAVRLFTAPF